MAKATVKLPTTVLDELTAAGARLDEHAEAALKAAGSVVEPVMRANLDSSITGRYSTGQLVAALGVTPVKTDRARPSSNAAPPASRPVRFLPAPAAPPAPQPWKP